ncbi:MAG: type IV toxin-antitoxin system AbiEi family antitoxin domain-containing protein [Nocardioides sp.]
MPAANPLPDSLTELMRLQGGVVSRRQAMTAGLTDNDIERLLRRREWATVHAGVYVDHTGPLTELQRHWAAVLRYWPAALYGESALEAFGALPHRRPGRPSGVRPVHVAVAHPRKAANVDGVRLHRVVDLDDRVAWHLSPPRLHLEEAVLVVCAAAPSRARAFAVAADACGQRRTTAERILAALGSRRMTHGAWLRRVLPEIAEGAHSVLERGYLHLERQHGLPAAIRQRHQSTSRGIVYRDAEYKRFGVVVELDGRLGHEWATDRWADMDRDLDTSADGRVTVRLGWRHVEETGCLTALRIGQLLQARGWRGRIRECGRGCPVSSAGTTQAG